MATKLSTLISIVTGYFSSTQLNSNFSDIADEFDNTVSRDGTSPNTMSADFDLNDNDLLNAKDINADNMYIAGTKVVATTAVPTWQGAWVTTTAYALDDMVKDSGNSYICVIAHTSGTFATDLAAVKWDTMATKGASGAGSGDLLASNDLSDVDSVSTARTNLGLTIGTDVQAQDDVLDDLSGLTQATDKIPYFSSATAAALLDFVDEDAMGSDSATALASQQSIKAYVDAQITANTSTTYASVATTVAASTEYTFAHSLSATPEVVSICLICTSTDGGWAVNDTIDISFGMNDAAGAVEGINVFKDGTNVKVRIGDNGLPKIFRADNFTTHYTPTITKWKVLVTAIKFA